MTRSLELQIEKLQKKYKVTLKDLARNIAGPTAVAGAIGLGLDLAFTAGFGTVLGICTATPAALWLTVGNIPYINESGQNISASRKVKYIIFEMEVLLKTQFKKAISRKATLKDMKEFLRTLQEVEKDIQSISSAYKCATDGWPDDFKAGVKYNKNFMDAYDLRKLIEKEIEILEKDEASKPVSNNWTPPRQLLPAPSPTPHLPPLPIPPPATQDETTPMREEVKTETPPQKIVSAKQLKP